MPGGAWSLPGGHLPVLFANTYHQFTINEWLPISATLTAVAAQGPGGISIDCHVWPSVGLARFCWV